MCLVAFLSLIFIKCITEKLLSAYAACFIYKTRRGQRARREAKESGIVKIRKRSFPTHVNFRELE